MRNKIQLSKKTFGTLVGVSCVLMSGISASATDTADLTVTIDTGSEITLKDTDTNGYYEIGSADELFAFAYAVNGGNTAINGELTADIAVNDSIETNSRGIRKWTPIGNRLIHYTGTFNGNGNTISGVYFNNSRESYVGLFGYIGTGGAVNGTGVENSYFGCKSYAGGIAGYNYGTISDCYNTGELNISDRGVGGIVGNNYGTIENSYNTGNVNGVTIAGGIVGTSNGDKITNCYNTGNVSGEYGVAGVVGYNYDTIENCSNTGTITATDKYIGGFTGYNSGGTIINSYNTGDVNGTGNYVGGFAGYNNKGTIKNSYTTANVEGTENVDSFIGVNSKSTTIKNNYYLADNEADAVYGTNFKTEAQFNSGEVAYLLQSEQTAMVWGQEIGTDTTPVIGGIEVYEVADCKGNVAYSNSNETVHSFNNTHVCKDCFALEAGNAAGVAGYNLGLGGNIAVNYYMVIDEAVAADENTKVVFTTPSSTSEYSVKDATKNGSLYVFACEVPAKEMTSDITCEVVTGDTVNNTFTYSVTDYTDTILANPDKYEKELPLVKAMLNYGAYAQQYFNYNTDNLANAALAEADKALVETLDLSEYAFTTEGEQAGVGFYGAALSLESETAIKLYFSFDSEVDVENLEITVNDTAVEAKKNGKYYEVKISDIPANALDKAYVVKVGEYTVNYSVFSYGNLAMNTNKDSLKNMVKAMYAYNQISKGYVVA